MVDYKKFFEYFKDLYGTGLSIIGWHLNGEPEDFDNFFDSAVEYMEGKDAEHEVFQDLVFPECMTGKGLR